MPKLTQLFEQMRTDGVVFFPEGSRTDGSVCLATHNPDFACRYDMHEESEYLPEDKE